MKGGVLFCERDSRVRCDDGARSSKWVSRAMMMVITEHEVRQRSDQGTCEAVELGELGVPPRQMQAI